MEDNPHPLAELRRLLNLRKAYDHEDRGDGYVAQKDFIAASKEYQAAAQLAPDNDELLFWYAVQIYPLDEPKSLELFRKVFRRDRRWLELIDRLPASELLKAEAPKQ